MTNIDLATGLPVIASVKVELVGEISEDKEYFEIVDWEDGSTTIDSSEGDVIRLTPELVAALRARFL